MDTKTKIQCFEYFLYEIVRWYKNVFPGNSISLTRVKVLKLLFLTSAIKCKDGADLLDIFDNFYAMQHGPVESDIYNAMNNGAMVHYRFDQQNIKVIDDSDCDSSLSDTYKERIKQSLTALYNANQNIIRLSSFQLVEITHKWNCWSNAMSVASVLGKGSYIMSSDNIRNSNSVFK